MAKILKHQLVKGRWEMTMDLDVERPKYTEGMYLLSDEEDEILGDG